MKTCSKCKQLKNDNDFHKKKSGLQGYCKVCNLQNSVVEYQRYWDSLTPEQKQSVGKVRTALNRIKAIVKKRDNHTCQLCGTTEKLHTHHIHSKKNRPDLILDPNNIITLCETCHLYKAHDNGNNRNTNQDLIPVFQNKVSENITARLNEVP